MKGSLSSCLGMHEAVNFQSNLDTQQMDVSQDLMNVFSDQGLVTFIQLYTDSPAI